MTGHIDSASPFPSDPFHPSDSPTHGLSGLPREPRARGRSQASGRPLPSRDALPTDSAGALAEETAGTEPQVVLRSPADLADALPYLLGFHPDDSVVLIGLHGSRGRFGARLRVDIPADPAGWPPFATGLADNLVNGAGPARRPDAVALFLCQDPAPGKSPTGVMERLRPLAQYLRRACGALDVPVIEAVCVAGGHWWSYTCVSAACCPPGGAPLNCDGTSVMAATAAYAGIQVRGSLRDLQSRLIPLSAELLPAQQGAFDDASAELVPRMLVHGDTHTVQEETLALASAAMDRLRAAPAPDEAGAGDRHDDALLGDDEAATIILGLQDRDTRDRAAEWMEGDEAPPALRLWRALSRRCLGAYAGHAAAPLTLAGWVAWATGDEPAARVAFGLALEADSEYTFARLLHQACNHGLDPEPLRSCLREERVNRTAKAVRRPRSTGAGTAPKGRRDRSPRPTASTRPGGVRPRTRRSDRTGGEETPC
ncbi:DUF4192 domain-containing protein [Streptantibioticus silvisoli]|uniref:DUF4192 domain-containing protein n=1 Tax=Streptantibioticus silvisoli TaxID=2705255 RepID=A0ABT6W8X5_9ACTN|nr:DUF4192 domain-containing protein [Streptantibioticus silvisoli]MDI5966392.1 DUF4192 domain-containing protein [Streptantibioticus silvisoli]